MTREEREEAIELQKGQLNRAVGKWAQKRITHAIEALEAMPCEDAVSREAVLNTLDTMDKALDENRTIEAYKELLKECYRELSPVTPERPKGGFTRQELENWLYSICLNNVGTDFCKDTEEIISRLDGFEQYVKDMRGSEPK